MKILAFDTTMQACSVAVFDSEDNNGTCSIYEEIDRGHAEILMPMILKVMEQANVEFQDLDRIAVTLGPGTFTGVRVGIATARGFGLGLDVEMRGFSSLHVMACKALDLLGAERVSEFEQLVVLRDARRGELYAQVFDTSSKPLISPTAIEYGEVITLLENKASVLVGNGGDIVRDRVKVSDQTVAIELPDLLPDASFLCRLAYHEKGIAPPFSPTYLRAPDAKPQIGKHVERAGV